ncbi:MAG: hypothetical protein WBE40_07770 [Thermoplasmata archaeon]
MRASLNQESGPGRATSRDGTPVGSPRAPLRIAFFSSFYPRSERLGSVSTSLVWVLSRDPDVGRVDLFVNTNSRLPPGFDSSRVVLHPTWEYDRLGTLVGTLLRMLRATPHTDLFIFNIYVTSFGRRPLVNALGLVLPVFVRRFSGKPTLAYVHNLVETQDVQRLGYAQGSIEVRLARILEGFLIRHVTTVVPLESQRIAIERNLGLAVKSLTLPYMEGIYPAAQAHPDESAPPSEAPNAEVRVLFFGFWGPQKDLVGFLRAIAGRVRGSPGTRVTVAGAVNPAFPEYQATFDAARREFASDRTRFVGPVPEERVFDLFLASDLLVLPYRATGGLSGVMTIGALAGLVVVAPDLPQLGELATALDVRVSPFPVGDAVGMGAAFDAAVEMVRRAGPRSAAAYRERLGRAETAVRELLLLGRPPLPRASGPVDRPSDHARKN